MNNGPFNKFTKNARLILTEAQKLAEADKEPLSTERILLSIIQIPGTLAHDILREYSVNLDQVKLVLSLTKSKRSVEDVKITPNAKDALRVAFRIAADFGHYNVDTEHILIALLSSESFQSYNAIKKVGIDPEQIKDQLTSIFHDLAEMDEMIKRQRSNSQNLQNEEFPAQPQEHFQQPTEPEFQMPQMPPHLAKPKKALEYFATNLVEKAKKGEIDPVWGREAEINRAVQILLRRSKNNPVFIGEPGVGKTAIVEGLALKIAQDKVPSKLSGKKLYQLDLGLLVAGTMYRGQFEDRLKKLLGEIKEDRNAIIFIDELHSIIGTGSAEGSMDAANLLKPALSKGEIRMIGATTYDEYRKHLEKDTALERRLQTIQVKEPSVKDTIQILNNIKSLYEKHHGIKIDNTAIHAAAKLSSKYINYRSLPDKAIDLIDEAAAGKVLLIQDKEKDDLLRKLNKQYEENISIKERLIHEEKFEEAAKIKEEELKILEKIKSIETADIQLSEPLDEEDITKLISQITGIPIGNLLQAESEKFLNIEKELSKYIAGQKEAISEISKALRRNRAGISSEKKPIGSFIFLGPSGVGKTEVARVLAKHIFGTETSLIKIDMSEFMERHNTARLIGAPPGYVGYDESGKLTEAVRRTPYSVILFDEIEKAHPDVFNILLQILDEGKLTDSKGREVDFRNTIIIMTSNIGIDQYRKMKKIGFDLLNDPVSHKEQIKGKIKDKLFEVFKPELINRLDRIAIFDPLTKEDLIKIAKIHLQKLSQRLSQRKIKITFTDKVLESLTEKGFDPLFGARPMIRLIEEKVENLLSEKIISGEMQSDQKFTMTVKSGKYTIR